VDSLHGFRSRFGARLTHPSGHHDFEIANQPSKQAIRHQRLSLQASVCFTAHRNARAVLRLNDTDSKCRIWIPAFAHLSFYLDFIRHGRDNIGIVSTVAMEELWVTLALVSASTPALMRLAKRFTTSGVTLGTTHASSRSGSRTKEFTQKLASFSKNKPTTTTSKIASGDMILRPDEGFGTVVINATKATGEDASIGSNAESHIGILRQVEFDVSYETKG